MLFARNNFQVPIKCRCKSYVSTHLSSSIVMDRFLKKKRWLQPKSYPWFGMKHADRTLHPYTVTMQLKSITLSVTLSVNTNENTKKALIYSQHIYPFSKNHSVESVMHYWSEQCFFPALSINYSQVHSLHLYFCYKQNTCSRAGVSVYMLDLQFGRQLQLQFSPEAL